MKIERLVGPVPSTLILLCALAMFARPAATQQPAQEQSGAAAQGQASADEQPRVIKIGSGDLLQVSIFGMPDLASTVRVSASGNVYLPLIGNVDVAGLTPERAQQRLAEKYEEGNFLRNPQVSVFVKEYATQGVSVMGEVIKPGIYPLLGEVRLYDAIAAAGGTTPRAGTRITILHRAHPNEPETIRLTSASGRASESNVPILPGDTVIISKAGVVYVVGDVNKPGGFVMEHDESLTAMQAIALAQGTARSAALNKARLIRKGPQGYEELPIPLGKIFAAKAQDVKLQAEDILFVPGSAAKSAAKRGIEAILQTLPGVAIYSTVH